MAMQNIEPLILDLVEWVGKEPRAYADVMDAWKTSCPRLTVWEDAVDRGYVVRKYDAQGQRVFVTPAGYTFLKTHNRVRTHENHHP